MAGRPKLLTRPPQLGGVLIRERLHGMVGATPIVAIVGPLGSGCTTAAAHIAAATGSTVVWCRLANGYNTAGDVIEMMADTLGAEVVSARRVIEIADQLLDLFELGDVSVVIDDYHLAADGDLDRVIAECTDLIPPGSKVIVASAARPAGLIGLVAPSKRCVIDAADLAFGDDEARDLFALQGGSEHDALRWNEQLGGWAQGVAAGAHAPDSDPSQHVVALLDQLIASDPTGGELVDAVAALGYVTVEVLAGLGIGIDRTGLARVVDGTPLLTDHDGYVRIADAAGDAQRMRLQPERVAELRRVAGSLIAADDPTTAIDLLIEAGEPEQAADVLADHLSEIGVERALNWLYRLPADLRRRFPPVLAAGQATVEVDAALAAAQARVEVATNERSRREALFALGSIEAHRGELAAAAGALEGALRSARGDTDSTHRIGAELATTRWLLGDMLGARTTLSDLPATPANRWLSTQLAVAEGASLPSADAGVEGEAEAYTLATDALVALIGGENAAAGRNSAAAYSAAVEGGGEPFVAASAVRAWSLLVDGAHADALAVAEELERRLGPHHQLARVHGAIIRERVARAAGDAGRHEREQRRLRDLRARGYAAVEQLAQRVLDGDGAVAQVDQPSVMVEVLGEHRVLCEGRVIRRSDWTSKKALEVLTVLAACGEAGGRREQIVEAVWPGREPAKGRTLLRTALSGIRRVLEPDRPPGESARYLTASDDVIVLDGVLDLDLLDGEVTTDPVATFSRLSAGLAATVVGAEWAQQWLPRVERMTLLAAANVPDNAERPQRIEALEALIAAEPWQRGHYDRLAELHRSDGDEPAAADVERRWFADD